MNDYQGLGVTGTYRWFMDEYEVIELQKRTQERQKQAKEALGDKWICHPSQRPHQAELRAQRSRLILQTPA